MNGSRACTARFHQRFARTAMENLEFNGDNRGDVLTYDAATGTWAMALNGGAGVVGALHGAWSAGWTIRAAEWNGDGRTDLFLYNPSSGEWAKATNDGRGGFNYASSSWSPDWEVVVLDLNGDRLSDVFVYNRSDGHWFKCIKSRRAGSSMTRAGDGLRVGSCSR